MNIRDNIANYLFDREYVVCTYDNYVYVFNYKYLESFSDSSITLKLEKKRVKVLGGDLAIVRITKEEILIRGEIKDIEMSNLWIELKF